MDSWTAARLIHTIAIVFLHFALVLVGLLLAPVLHAEQIDIANFNQKTDITGSTTDCTNLDTAQQRLDCYQTLCEPSYECAEAIIANATFIDGPTVGSMVIHDLITQPALFSTLTDGHELSHIVGRTTAKAGGINGTAFESCPNDFLYGCPHGFFEQALAEYEGASKDVATRICESVTTKPVEHNKFYCYHGVGHGIMMAKANDIYESLRICDQLPTDRAKQGCYQGAFMENINAIQTGVARDGVFKADEPLAPCTLVPLKYQWNCYENHSAYLVGYTDYDLAAAANECMRAEESKIPACIISLAQLTTNPGWQASLLAAVPEQSGGKATFLERAVYMCTLFPEAMVDNCYEYAVNNLLNYDQWQQAAEYCSLVPALQTEACVGKVGSKMYFLLYAEEQKNQLCSLMQKSLKGTCLAYARGEITHIEIDSRQDEQLPEPTNWFGRLLAWLSAIFKQPERPKEVPLAPDELPPNLNRNVNDGTVTSRSLVQNSLVIRLLPSGIFEPSTLTIKAGETVTWVNNTTDPFWPASDNHPTHQLLSEFDARKPLSPDEAYSYTFNTAGSWTFHDHLMPRATGIIIVE